MINEIIDLKQREREREREGQRDRLVIDQREIRLREGEKERRK